MYVNCLVQHQIKCGTNFLRLYLFMNFFCRTGVRLGEWNTTSAIDCYEDDCADTPLNVQVEQIIIHGNFDSASASQQNDIALIRLASKVQFTGIYLITFSKSKFWS